MQGRRELQKSGGGPEALFCPTFYCIFMWQFFGISKVRGGRGPPGPPSYDAPDDMHFSNHGVIHWLDNVSWFMVCIFLVGKLNHLTSLNIFREVDNWIMIWRIQHSFRSNNNSLLINDKPIFNLLRVTLKILISP